MLFDLSRKQIEIRLCLRDCCTRLETSDHGQEPVRTFFTRFPGEPLRRKHRLPKILRIIIDGILEPGRHDADHCSFSAEVYLATDNIGITSKAPLPETMAEKDHVSSARFVFVAREDASEHWLHIEEWEVIRGDGCAEDALGVASTVSNNRSGLLKHRYVCKRRRRFLHVEEVWNREGAAAVKSLIALLGCDPHELFRMFVRERLQQHRVDDGKDRGVGAD